MMRKLNFQVVQKVLFSLIVVLFIGCGDDSTEITETPDPTVTTDSTETKGLVAHYEFEGNANDSSGKGNNGTEHGGVTYIDGVIGKAGHFDGVDDYIQIPALETNFDEITISTWIYFKSPKSWGRIIDLSNGNEENNIEEANNILFAEDATTSNLCFEVYSNNSSFSWETQKVEVANGISFGEWKHYTSVASKKNGKMEVSIYINGEKQATIDRNGDTNSITNVPDKIKREFNYIAKSAWSRDEYFNGSIDDLRIYNRALSESEVKGIYKMKK